MYPSYAFFLVLSGHRAFEHALLTWSSCPPCKKANQLYTIPPAAPTPVPPASVFPTNHDPSPPLERTPSMAPGAEEDVKPTMGTVGIGAEESAAADTGDAGGAADGTTFTSGEKTDGAQQTNGAEEAHQSTNGRMEGGETTAAAPSGQGETTAEEPDGPTTSYDAPIAPVEPPISLDAPSHVPPTADAPPASPHSTPPPPTPPTTRSKTLPSRRPATPPPPSPPPPIRRGVMTLSDVLAAKHVLAEKANAHWAKGLGGGQNKESETIVNFLYKMKVGPGSSNPFSFPSLSSHSCKVADTNSSGRLLRVYNPMTSAQPPWL